MCLFSYLKNVSRVRAVTTILMGFLLLVIFSPAVTKATATPMLPAILIISVPTSSHDYTVVPIQPNADYNQYVLEPGNNDSPIKRIPSNDTMTSSQTHEATTSLNRFSTYTCNCDNISVKNSKSAYLLADMPPPSSIICS
jgi:hypothetical protein